jgi:hypothetical protein
MGRELALPHFVRRVQGGKHRGDPVRPDLRLFQLVLACGDMFKTEFND